MDEVGWPEPAAVLHRIESTRNCWPSCRANSRSVVASVSVTVISLPTTTQVVGTPEAMKRAQHALVRAPMWLVYRSVAEFTGERVATGDPRASFTGLTWWARIVSASSDGQTELVEAASRSTS